MGAPFVAIVLVLKNAVMFSVFEGMRPGGVFAVARKLQRIGLKLLLSF
jgi:hypothetical protein